MKIVWYETTSHLLYRSLWQCHFILICAFCDSYTNNSSAAIILVATHPLSPGSLTDLSESILTLPSPYRPFSLLQSEWSFKKCKQLNATPLQKLSKAPHLTQNPIEISLIVLQGLAYSLGLLWLASADLPVTCLASSLTVLSLAHSALATPALVFSNMPDELPLQNLCTGCPSTPKALLPDTCILPLLQAFLQMSFRLYCSLSTYTFRTMLTACSTLFF